VLPEVLSLRGHRVTKVEHDAVDPSSPELVGADLIVVDVELAERVELVGKLMSGAPGIEIVLVGPKRDLAPDVFAQLERPLDVDRLLAHVDELADILDGERLREPIDLVAYETLFAGDSPQIRDLVRRVRLVARSDAPVWIFGDDGSGRAIIARAIHDRSPRRAQPFVAYNTAAYSDEELCKLLFHGDKPAIAMAQNGTLFLERIAAAGPQTQRELVKYLEQNKDGASPRILVGVPRALALDGAQQVLSSDLYYRLKVLEVEIPLLKDRARDLEQIVGRMLERLAPGAGSRIAPDTMRILERYNFPGNLLELAHALTHAYVLASGAAIEPQHLPISIRRVGIETSGVVTSPAELEALDVVAKRFERDYLLQVLRNVGGNRGRAAEILGLSRKGLWGKLKSHGISDDDIEDEA
jgi:two-component system response regulator AtoC